MEIKTFRINKYILLKLENKRTNLYVGGEKFIQCKFLVINVPINDIVGLEELRSVDEFSDRFTNSHFPLVPPEVEFWGHCSNLQVFAENNYNTNLLHSNIVFSLLKRLAEIGDPIARRVFKDEIIKRIEAGYIPTIIYLVMSHYLDFFSQEEFNTLVNNFSDNRNVLEEDILNLIWSFQVGREALSSNSIIFLVEFPKIRLFELLIKFGKKFFESDGEFIGDFRQWVSKILRKLKK